MERAATDTSFWRRLLSGDWRVSATILAFVGIGSWWLVPERRQRRR